MALRPLKITFQIDPAGIIYDPLNPLMLDSLIDWCLSPMVRKKGPPTRSEEPEEIRLPLGTWHVGEYWGWCASAMLPEGEVQETIRHYRKKFRANRVSLTAAGMPNLQSGPTREYNLPFVQQLPDELIAYAIGDRKRIKDLFRRNLRYLGQKRRRGMGRIEDWSIEIIDDDYSLIRDGLAMRWLPDATGLRAVRLRPPYWNNNGRVLCCEIGDKYNIPIKQP